MSRQQIDYSDDEIPLGQLQKLKAKRHKKKCKQVASVELDGDLWMSLPQTLAARIVSYNVRTTIGIAKLSTIGRSFGRMLKGYISAVGAKHTIECPNRLEPRKSYAQDIIDLAPKRGEPDNDSFPTYPGDLYAVDDISQGVFVGDGVRFEKFMRIAPEARREKILDHITLNNADTEEKKKNLAQNIKSAISSMINAK